jgi:hypothetical protein
LLASNPNHLNILTALSLQKDLGSSKKKKKKKKKNKTFGITELEQPDHREMKKPCLEIGWRILN